jgi:hypothetical protein
MVTNKSTDKTKCPVKKKHSPLVLLLKGGLITLFKQSCVNNTNVLHIKGVYQVYNAEDQTLLCIFGKVYLAT